MTKRNGTLDAIKQINDELKKAARRQLDDSRSVTPPRQLKKEGGSHGKR